MHTHSKEKHQTPDTSQTLRPCCLIQAFEAARTTESAGSTKAAKGCWNGRSRRAGPFDKARGLACRLRSRAKRRRTRLLLAMMRRRGVRVRLTVRAGGKVIQPVPGRPRGPHTPRTVACTAGQWPKVWLGGVGRAGWVSRDRTRTNGVPTAELPLTFPTTPSMITMSFLLACPASLPKATRCI